MSASRINLADALIADEAALFARIEQWSLSTESSTIL